MVKSVHVGYEGAVSVVWGEFLVPGWDIYSRLWHWVVVAAREAKEAGGPIRQPYARVDYIPQSGTKNLASVPAEFTSLRNELSGRGGVAIIIG